MLVKSCGPLTMLVVCVWLLFEWENELADLFLRTVLLIGATMLSALQNTGFTGSLLTESSSHLVLRH